MSFLHPLLLAAGLGIGLPILAHLLSRYQVQRTDWAAMRFLNRSVRVRSRQLRLRDILRTPYLWEVEMTLFSGKSAAGEPNRE